MVCSAQMSGIDMNGIKQVCYHLSPGEDYNIRYVWKLT